MRIPSNNITDIKYFFYKKLEGIFPKSEIDLFFKYCIEDFCANPKTQNVSESELLKFNFAVKDLKQHTPIQYVVGNAHFYGLKFFVNKHVLIPRPETEELVDLIIKENQELRSKNQEITLLDIGTGSGCIPISLKNKFSEWDVFAMDVSSEALAVASKNAINNNVKINYIEADILKDCTDLFKTKFDIIVSNPPYIKHSEKHTMHPNVLNHEPHIALFVNDENPLLFYEAIMHFAKKMLKNDGKIYFEINEQLGAESEALMVRMGFKNVKLIKDLSNKNRILQGIF